jgi:hypothetical protein
MDPYEWDGPEPEILSPAKRKKLKAAQAKQNRARKRREKLVAESPWIDDPHAAKVFIQTKDGTYQLAARLERFETDREVIHVGDGPWTRMMAGVSISRFTIASSGPITFTSAPTKRKRK